MRRRRAYDRAGARVELGAVTWAHDEVGGGGIADGAPGMGTDGVVGDEAVLGGLKDETRVARLWIGETRGPTHRHLAGQANRSPRVVPSCSESTAPEPSSSGWSQRHPTYPGGRERA